MATKTTRKLMLKKETLRTLDSGQLARIAGGGVSGPYCTVVEGSGRCGSVTDDCAEVTTGGVIIKVSG